MKHMHIENENSKKTFVKLIALLSFVIFVFISTNLVWIFTTYIPYHNFASNLEKFEEDGKYVYYEKNVGGYTYHLSMPEYLDFSGFLSVSDSEGYVVTQDNDGNITSTNGISITLFIWPKVFSDYKYGVFILDDAQGIWEQIYIDKNLKYIPVKENIGNKELNDYIEKLIADNYEEIKTLMSKAYLFWDFS